MKIMRNTKNLLIVVVFSLSVFMLGGCGSSPSSSSQGTESKATPQGAKQEPVVKIGAAVSNSGVYAKEGQETKIGYEVWKDTVNSKGGIKVGGQNYKVEIIYYDDKSDAQTAAKLIEKLITEDKVKFILGPYTAGITDAAATIGERYKVITIASNAFADALFDKGRKYLFCGGSRASIHFESFFKMAKQLDPGLKTVAIASPDTLAAIGWADSAKNYAEQMGLVVTYQKYPFPAKDLSSVALTIKEKSPDIVIATGYIEDTILLIRQMRDLRFTPKMLGGANPTVGYPLIEGLGKDAEGFVAVEYWAPTVPWKDNVFGDAKDYLKALQDHGVSLKQLNTRFTNASQAGLMLQLAIEKAGTIEDNDKIREALLSLNVQTLFGPIKLENPNGINNARISMIVQVQNGQFVPIYPKEVAQSPPIYPLKKWNER